MNPVSALPAVAALVVALGMAHVCHPWIGDTPVASSQLALEQTSSRRNVTIDGLRGFLAFFVFLHHAVIWYFYLRSGQWQTPPSYFYVHLGQSSVALFFMITAFLFSTKLLNNRSAHDKASLKSTLFWQRLYVSRIMRLAPLYFFMLTIVLLLTALASHFQLREPLPVLLKSIGQWASFTILGRPDLNGVVDTARMIAGVNWTLPYEWFFYLALPVVALLLRVLPPWPYALLGIASLTGLYFWQPALIYLLAFAGGMTAAVLVRLSALPTWLAGKTGAFVVLVCLVVVFKAYPTVNTLPAMGLLTLVFTILASGNTLFGLLHTRVAQALGDASYSIYLLHGLVLYIAFTLVLGVDAASRLSASGHWGVVLLCTVVLIPLSLLTFHWIEAPAIRSAPHFSGWLESRRQAASMGVQKQKKLNSHRI